mgnify:CR=1 FL=1|tara:strand:- start:53 stop:448 length:396 start_codon:yes stop_codon:yes gene_type:complete
MTTAIILVLIGIGLHLYNSKNEHYTSEENFSVEFEKLWKEFDIVFPNADELKDEIPSQGKDFDISSFYQMTETKPYKNLSKQEQSQLVLYLQDWIDLEQRYFKNSKLESYIFYAANSSLLVALILFLRYFL